MFQLLAIASFEIRRFLHLYFCLQELRIPLSRLARFWLCKSYLNNFTRYVKRLTYLDISSVFHIVAFRYGAV